MHSLPLSSGSCRAFTGIAKTGEAFGHSFIVSFFGIGSQLPGKTAHGRTPDGKRCTLEGVSGSRYSALVSGGERLFQPPHLTLDVLHQQRTVMFDPFQIANNGPNFSESKRSLTEGARELSRHEAGDAAPNLARRSPSRETVTVLATISSRPPGKVYGPKPRHWRSEPL